MSEELQSLQAVNTGSLNFRMTSKRPPHAAHSNS
jgi:hypothetical protein